MAKIGIEYPTYAPITGEVYGTSVTYGTGVKMETIYEYLATADVAIKHANKSIYGSNRRAEHCADVTGYDITLDLTELTDATRAALLGEREHKTGTGTQTTDYFDVGGSAPYIGFGYIQCKLVNDVEQYEAYWFHKVKFALENENGKTEEEEIDFQPTQIKGTGCGCDLGDGVTWYHHMNFDTLAAAKAWVNGKAGITG